MIKITNISSGTGLGWEDQTINTGGFILLTEEYVSAESFKKPTLVQVRRLLEEIDANRASIIINTGSALSASDARDLVEAYYNKPYETVAKTEDDAPEGHTHVAADIDFTNQEFIAGGGSFGEIHLSANNNWSLRKKGGVKGDIYTNDLGQIFFESDGGVSVTTSLVNLTLSGGMRNTGYYRTDTYFQAYRNQVLADTLNSSVLLIGAEDPDAAVDFNNIYSFDLKYRGNSSGYFLDLVAKTRGASGGVGADIVPASFGATNSFWTTSYFYKRVHVGGDLTHDQALDGYLKILRPDDGKIVEAFFGSPTMDWRISLGGFSSTETGALYTYKQAGAEKYGKTLIGHATDTSKGLLVNGADGRATVGGVLEASIIEYQSSLTIRDTSATTSFVSSPTGFSFKNGNTSVFNINTGSLVIHSSIIGSSAADKLLAVDTSGNVVGTALSSLSNTHTHSDYVSKSTTALQTIVSNLTLNGAVEVDQRLTLDSDLKFTGISGTPPQLVFGNYDGYLHFGSSGTGNFLTIQNGSNLVVAMQQAATIADRHYRVSISDDDSVRYFLNGGAYNHDFRGTAKFLNGVTFDSGISFSGDGFYGPGSPQIFLNDVYLHRFDNAGTGTRFNIYNGNVSVQLQDSSDLAARKIHATIDNDISYTMSGGAYNHDFDGTSRFQDNSTFESGIRIKGNLSDAVAHVELPSTGFIHTDTPYGSMYIGCGTNPGNGSRIYMYDQWAEFRGMGSNRVNDPNLGSLQISDSFVQLQRWNADFTGGTEYGNIYMSQTDITISNHYQAHHNKFILTTPDAVSSNTKAGYLKDTGNRPFDFEGSEVQGANATQLNSFVTLQQLNAAAVPTNYVTTDNATGNQSIIGYKQWNGLNVWYGDTSSGSHHFTSWYDDSGAADAVDLRFYYNKSAKGSIPADTWSFINSSRQIDLYFGNETSDTNSSPKFRIGLGSTSSRFYSTLEVAGTLKLETISSSAATKILATDASGIVVDGAALLNAKEGSLGNPSTNGYVLSSTTSGTRSWVALPSNYITTDTTQTGLSGDKTTSGTWTMPRLKVQTGGDYIDILSSSSVPRIDFFVGGVQKGVIGKYSDRLQLAVDDLFQVGSFGTLGIFSINTSTNVLKHTGRALIANASDDSSTALQVNGDFSSLKAVPYNAPVNVWHKRGASNNTAVDSGQIYQWRDIVYGDATGQYLAFESLKRGSSTWEEVLRLSRNQLVYVKNRLLVNGATDDGSILNVNGNILSKNYANGDFVAISPTQDIPRIDFYQNGAYRSQIGYYPVGHAKFPNTMLYIANSGAKHSFSLNGTTSVFDIESSKTSIKNRLLVNGAADDSSTALQVNGAVSTSGSVYVGDDVVFTNGLEYSAPSNESSLLAVDSTGKVVKSATSAHMRSYTFTTPGSTTDWYPIVLGLGPGQHRTTYVNLGSSSRSGSDPFNRNVLHGVFVSEGWSDCPRHYEVTLDRYTESETTIGPIYYANSVVSASYNMVIWVRGNNVYDITTNASACELKTTNYNYIYGGGTAEQAVPLTTVVAGNDQSLFFDTPAMPSGNHSNSVVYATLGLPYAGLSNEGSSDHPLLVHKNSPTAASDWFRIGVSSGNGGLLPYSNDKSYVGTSTWRFSGMYATRFNSSDGFDTEGDGKTMLWGGTTSWSSRAVITKGYDTSDYLDINPIGYPAGYKALRLRNGYTEFRGSSFNVTIGKGLNSSAGNEIYFDREGINYLTVPASGSLRFSGGTTTLADISATRSYFLNKTFIGNDSEISAASMFTVYGNAAMSNTSNIARFIIDAPTSNAGDGGSAGIDYWHRGATGLNWYAGTRYGGNVFEFQREATPGGAYVTALSIGSDSISAVNGIFTNVSEGGVALSSKYLGINATAAEAYMLDSSSISDLNTAHTNAHQRKFIVNRFSASASNKPVAGNNANAVIFIGSHPGVYGKQIAFADDDNLYIRRVSNGSYGSWLKLHHSGNFNPGDYLPLSGGNLTGNLTSTGSFSNLNSNNTSANVMERNASGSPALLVIQKNTSTNVPIFHAAYDSSSDVKFSVYRDHTSVSNQLLLGSVPTGTQQYLLAVDSSGKVIQGSTPATPSLQQVTNQGNTTTNNIQANGYYVNKAWGTVFDPYYYIGNALSGTSERAWNMQPDSSNNLRFMHYNGSAWVNGHYLTSDGGLSLNNGNDRLVLLPNSSAPRVDFYINNIQDGALIRYSDRMQLLSRELVQLGTFDNHDILKINGSGVVHATERLLVGGATDDGYILNVNGNILSKNYANGDFIAISPTQDIPRLDFYQNGAYRSQIGYYPVGHAKFPNTMLYIANSGAKHSFSLNGTTSVFDIENDKTNIKNILLVNGASYDSSTALSVRGSQSNIIFTGYNTPASIWHKRGASNSDAVNIGQIYQWRDVVYGDANGQFLAFESLKRDSLTWEEVFKLDRDQNTYTKNRHIATDLEVGAGRLWLTRSHLDNASNKVFALQDYNNRVSLTYNDNNQGLNGQTIWDVGIDKVFDFKATPTVNGTPLTTLPTLQQVTGQGATTNVVSSFTSRLLVGGAADNTNNALNVSGNAYVSGNINALGTISEGGVPLSDLYYASGADTAIMTDTATLFASGDYSEGALLSKYYSAASGFPGVQYGQAVTFLGGGSGRTFTIAKPKRNAGVSGHEPLYYRDYDDASYNNASDWKKFVFEDTGWTLLATFDTGDISTGTQNGTATYDTQGAGLLYAGATANRDSSLYAKRVGNRVHLKGFIPIYSHRRTRSVDSTPMNIVSTWSSTGTNPLVGRGLSSSFTPPLGSQPRFIAMPGLRDSTTSSILSCLAVSTNGIMTVQQYRYSSGVGNVSNINNIDGNTTWTGGWTRYQEADTIVCVDGCYYDLD